MTKVGFHVHNPRAGLPSGVPIQIFYKSPYSLKSRGKLDPELFAGFKMPVFTHATYAINLGSKLSMGKLTALAENLTDDLDFLSLIPNGIGTVLHYKTGDHLYENVKTLLGLLGHYGKTLNKGPKLILENVKGTKIGEMYELQKDFPGRLGYCFDTCHLFISGYDLRDLKVCRKVFNQINNLFPDLLLIHFNDSASMTRDIHEEPGFGYIGNPKLGGNSRVFGLIKKILKDRNVSLISEINR